MTDSSPVFVDTNVLVYAKLAKSPMHSAAVGALHALEHGGAELWISRQVLREYLSAMTRPNTLTETIPTTSLVNDVTTFAAQFLLAEDGPLVTERLLDLVATVAVAGKQIHDANIVATMQAYGVTRLITHNTSDFTRFFPVDHGHAADVAKMSNTFNYRYGFHSGSGDFSRSGNIRSRRYDLLEN